MAAKGTFEYGSEKIPMRLTYSLATGKLEDLGIDVLGVLSDGGRTLQTILLDDKTLIKVWFHFVQEETGDDWETAIEKLDEQEGGLNKFREDFFQLIVNFSAPPVRKVLVQAWEQAKIQLKDQKKLKSLLLSQELLDGSESTSESSPSER